MPSVVFFLQVVTTGVSMGHTGNCHDISMIKNILETSFLGPEVVTGHSMKRDIENSLDLFVTEVEFREYRECCTGHSTQHDYKICHNRFPFHRRILVVTLEFYKAQADPLWCPPIQIHTLAAWILRGDLVSPVSVSWNNCKKTQNIANWIKPFICYKWNYLPSVYPAENGRVWATVKSWKKQHRGLDKLSFKFLAI